MSSKRTAQMSQNSHMMGLMAQHLSKGAPEEGDPCYFDPLTVPVKDHFRLDHSNLGQQLHALKTFQSRQQKASLSETSEEKSPEELKKEKYEEAFNSHFIPALNQALEKIHSEFLQCRHPDEKYVVTFYSRGHLSRPVPVYNLAPSRDDAPRREIPGHLTYKQWRNKLGVLLSALVSRANYGATRHFPRHLTTQMEELGIELSPAWEELPDEIPVSEASASPEGKVSESEVRRMAFWFKSYQARCQKLAEAVRELYTQFREASAEGTKANGKEIEAVMAEKAERRRQFKASQTHTGRGGARSAYLPRGPPRGPPRGSPSSSTPALHLHEEMGPSGGARVVIHRKAFVPGQSPAPIHTQSQGQETSRGSDRGRGFSRGRVHLRGSGRGRGRGSWGYRGRGRGRGRGPTHGLTHPPSEPSISSILPSDLAEMPGAPQMFRVPPAFGEKGLVKQT